MKRRKLLKNKTASYIAVSILTLALAGITCGTFAWFNYDTRTPVSELNGTTIGLGDLQMGFLSEADLPDYEQYDLIKDESNPNETIYWTSGHETSQETINYVLQNNGYATNTLYPTTTQKYNEESGFQLFDAPYFYHDISDVAPKEMYITLNLVFKYLDILNEDNPSYSNENIYLSKFRIQTDDENTFVHKAVRLYTNDKTGTEHLINPTVSDDGTTDVGGVLDLDKDGFYDTFDTSGDKYEHIYGQTTESSYKASPESEDTIVPENQRNSFVAGHKTGTYALESCVPEVAEYEGFYGFRNRRKCVTTTNPDTNNYAYLDLSIFIEGWDLNVIDSQIGMQFSIELTFDTAL